MMTARRSEKTGLPPGSLVHVGPKRAGKPRITLIDYGPEGVVEKDVEGIEACVEYKDTSTVTWIEVTGTHMVEVTEDLGRCFDIHPLVLEDILNTEQRPKIEDYDDYVFMVLKAIYYDETSGELRIEQVSLILGTSFVVSFQESETGIFRSVKERLRSAKSRIRKLGPDYLAYALVDVVVDNYFTVLEKVDEEVEEVEEALLGNPVPETLKSLHALKRDMVYFRRSIWPLREIIGWLTKGGSALIRGETVIYLRDVYDHTVQVMDTIESIRDILSGMLDIYLSNMSNRMNEIMKVLTIIATVFIPITFVTSLYGMNFKYMPELEWPFGYPLVLLVLVAMAGAMFAYFRKKGWI